MGSNFRKSRKMILVEFFSLLEKFDLIDVDAEKFVLERKSEL